MKYTIGFWLFLLSPILVLFLAIYYESDPPEKIYPESGLFMEDRKYGYAISCGLENIHDIKMYEIRLVVNKLKETVSLINEDGIPTVENIDFYADKVAFEADGMMYFLNRFTGEINAGRGYPEATGNCIEEGWRWSVDETRNVAVYEKDMKYKQN